MPFSAILLLVAAMLSIQSGAALAKQLFPLAGPAGVTLLRTFFAALVLLALFRPWRLHWSQSKLRVIILYGLSLGAMNLCFYLSLQRIPLGIAVALEFTGPLSIAIFSSRKALDFLWVLFASSGIVLLLPLTKISLRLDSYGTVLALLAGFFWALYILFGKKAGEGTEGGPTASLGMVFAALISCPFGAVSAVKALENWHILFLGFTVAILSSAVPYSLEMIALKKIPLKTFGILMSIEPLLAALSGALFLKEYLSLPQMGAILCIVVASLGSSWTSRRVSPPRCLK